MNFYEFTIKRTNLYDDEVDYSYWGCRKNTFDEAKAYALDLMKKLSAYYCLQCFELEELKEV